MSSHQLMILNNKETFESAICDLFNLLESTNTFKKFGKNGHQQKGIDIFSSEKDFDIQCKKKDLSRKDIVLKRELLNDIEADVKKTLSNNLTIKISRFYIVSTFKDDPEFDEFCEDLKEKFNTNFEIIYWGWDTLQSRILDQKTLLAKYWPNFIITENSQEKELLRNLQLKSRIKTDFGDWLNYSIENRKRRSRMILRDFRGNQYPKSNEPDEYGEYSWFAAEIKGSYHNGLEFFQDTDIYLIERFENNLWDVRNLNSKNENVVSVGKIGRITFSDIIDYDIKGDEHYNCPHIYCKFKYKGLPFENSYYYNLDRRYETYELEDKRSTEPIQLF